MKKFTNKKTDCTGDACMGDYVFFQKAIFVGRYPKSKFSHTEDVEGLIINDSYGDKKQQHTFTIQLEDNSTMRIKGRNLYRNGCQRLIWKDESKRNDILNEKHERGEEARKKAEIRKAHKYSETVYEGGFDNDGSCMYCGSSNGHYLGCAGITHY